MTFLYKNIEVYSETVNEKPLKVAVLLYRFDDAYISLVRENLEEIQKQNSGKVEFTFYDGNDNQIIQNQSINLILNDKSADFILLNIVDVNKANEVISRIKENNIPVILFNREPFNMGAVQSYAKAYFVGTNSVQAGTMQGDILSKAWKNNKDSIDKNGDNIMKYIMLIGERNNKDAIERTQYSVASINDAGIKTEQLASTVCNWNREIAKENFEPIFLRYSKDIEAIISNNDEMAIGAIEVMQKYGYNKGENTPTIAVVGVDAIPEAQELIKQKVMTGSVLQDAKAMAEASYNIGINVINNRNPLEKTPYKFDETGVAVRIPYKEYTE